MDSWLKAAEDLFEAVDQREKLVVGEKTDELPVLTAGICASLLDVPLASSSGASS